MMEPRNPDLPDRNNSISPKPPMRLYDTEMASARLEDLSCVLLAGGKGTRLGGEYGSIPKPLVRIGPYPIIMHIISIYYRAGIRNFLICTGFKSSQVGDYFDEVAMKKNENVYYLKPQIFPRLFSVQEHANLTEDFSVDLLYTGIDSTTAGRVKQAIEKIQTNEFFCTYGDGVASLDVRKVYEFHTQNSFDITMTAFHPPSRFGEVIVDNFGKVQRFQEKQLSSTLVNGGFFVVNSNVYDKINEVLSLEEGLLTDLTATGKLGAFISKDYWQMMDTPREVELLNHHYMSSDVPWLKT